MKKSCRIIVLGFVLVFALISCALIGCSEGHIHNFMEVKDPSNTESTCITPGRVKVQCTECGATEWKERELKDHTYAEISQIPATCTEKGEKTEKCTVCGAERKSEIQPLNHLYETKITTEPTCLAEGVRSSICTRCGDVRKTEPVKKLDHKYELAETITPPTCEEKGVGVYKCVNGCEQVNPDITEIPALGHNISKEWTVDKQATYDVEGLRSHHCLNEGCTHVEDEEVVPKLPTQYVIKFVVQMHNRAVDMYSPQIPPTVHFIDVEKEEEIGSAVAKGEAATGGEDTYANKNAAITQLPSSTYKLEITDLPPGYKIITPEDQLKVSRANPQLTINVSVEMVDKESDAEMKYCLGAVLKDTEITIVGETKDKDVTKTLKEYIGSRKGLYINIFDTSKQYSMNGIPHTLSAYRSKGEEVAFMLLSYKMDLEQLREFKTHASKYIDNYNYSILNMDVVYCPEITEAFNFKGNKNTAPATFFVNCDSLITYAYVSNSMDSDRIKQLIDSFIIDYYDKAYPSGKPTSYLAPLPEAIIEKRESY